MSTPPFRVSCDSVVVVPPRTVSTAPIFAKNSDRPPDEAQPLIQVAAAEHGNGTKLRCQYIEIDQVPRTAAFLGSRPHWLWGCEHGVNEHGVAVGNHTIYTKDSVPDSGLQGMDLVRLALERGTNARGAVEVITSLIERHGQGGSGFADMHWPYNNSFLVADHDRAFLLECSGTRWALKHLKAGGSASNHTAIGTDWDELSSDCIEHAVERGWCQPSSARFDFAAAYRDESVVPGLVSSGRYRTTCSALAGTRVDVAALQHVMRDHYDHGETHAPGHLPDDERFFSVCMHAGVVGVTAASMVVELGSGSQPAPALTWVAFCNPCVSPYLPVFPEAAIPRPYGVGGAEPNDGGAWWRFKRLLTAVEQDYARHAERVRDTWRAFERELAPAVSSVTEAAAGCSRTDRMPVLEEFMRDTWAAAAEKLDALTAAIEG
jgi:dipeptidase